ncbi:hypothetical protein P4V41_07660 [Fictibacillus nanhaiensis]|uniref:hypothetical protein n=1 Tax=Fictibacillus nanhaiensis TaxID=742169 RepID=UPI002E2436A5|nr:hypothetical protein [Fictibacillus nanhaiensis]
MEKKYFYSNCFLESVKAWVKQPMNITIKKRGTWKMLYRKKKFPHFYWLDKQTGKHYDFARDKEFLTFKEQLLFKGFVREIRYMMFFGH